MSSALAIERGVNLGECEQRERSCSFTPERIQDICVFCDEFDLSKGTGLFYELFPEFVGEKQVLEETRHHVLLPDIGPLTQDYLLVVSKEHVPSFASLPTDYHDDYRLLVEKVIHKMGNLHPGKQPLIFEHGVGTVNGQFIRCGGCGRTDHAHLHVLPIGEKKHDGLLNSLSAQVKAKYDFEEYNVSDSTDLQELGFISKGRPYLMVGNQRESKTFVQNDINEIPSQYIRAFLGNHLDIAEHNWKILLAENLRLAGERIGKTIADWK